MTDKIIVYHSPLEEMRAEFFYEMLLDFATWLWLRGPTIALWYAIIAIVVACIVEIVDTWHKGFNGIGDGLIIGLLWPKLLWKLLIPVFCFIFKGKK